MLIWINQFETSLILRMILNSGIEHNVELMLYG